MLISDLNYFEGFVAEAPSIVGGNTNNTTIAKLNPALAAELKAAGFDDVANITVNVTSKKVNIPGGSASATSGNGKTKKGGNVSYSSANTTVMKK